MGLGKWFSGVLGRKEETPEQETAAGKSVQSESTITDAEKPDNFLFSLMVLASYVITADGKIMRSEMNCVHKTLNEGFGPEAVEKGEQTLRRMFTFARNQGSERFRQTIVDCCQRLSNDLSYGGRIQMLSFLIQIAQADGNTDDTELDIITDIASWLRVQGHELHTLYFLNGSTVDDAYNLLDVSPQATDDEVMQAFDKLAQLHHPDRVAYLGDAALRGARQKYQQIVDAKDRIMKARRGPTPAPSPREGR